MSGELANAATWEDVPALLEREADSRFEEDFARHERLTRENGMSLGDMMRAALDPDTPSDTRMACSVLTARMTRFLETEELKPDLARRYAHYASSGILSREDVDRAVDKALLMRRYPGLEERFSTASDAGAHRRELEAALRAPEVRPGLRLGIAELDALMNSGFGARPGETLHLVGPEGTLKTSLGLNALCGYVARGGRALLISLDMSPARVEERLLLRHLDCSVERLRELIRADAPEYREARRKREAEDGSLMVMGGPLNLEGVRAAALASGAGVVAVDYVTAVAGMESELAAARAMASLGRELTRRWGLSLLLLSQMSWASQRDQRSGGRGGHSMGGGSLGQFVDFEVELFRDEPVGAPGGVGEAGGGFGITGKAPDQNGPLIATLRKNRSGTSGVSFEIFPRYPSLTFEAHGKRVEPARPRRALFRAVI